uniref:Uncharacterized protein n=1 Tax=Arion vulgaris TaxID=1028688 RepID=A0A0B6ZY88_9EUPU
MTAYAHTHIHDIICTEQHTHTHDSIYTHMMVCTQTHNKHKHMTTHTPSV